MSKQGFLQNKFTSLVIFFVLLFSAPWPAFAVDMKGIWITKVQLVVDQYGHTAPEGTSFSYFVNPWWIKTQPNLDGALSGIISSGDTVGIGTVLGNISQRSFTLVSTQVNLPLSPLNFIGTVSEDGSTATGTWKWAGQWDGMGSGTFIATRSITSLSVKGQVLTPDQKRVAGITLNLTGETTTGSAVSKTATTDQDGYYSFQVEKGNYSVEATGEGDYDDSGVTKKENGGVLSAESDVGAVCIGQAQGNICKLTPVETESGRADFVYTLCAAEERMPNGKPLTHCPIVFVPGFLGTRIACDDGIKELWPGLPFPGWGKMYLQSDGETNETQNGDCNVSALALPGLDGLIGTVAGADIYQGVIDFFNKEAVGRWWAATYDWRKSPVLGAAKLDTVVDDALKTTGAKHVVLYGHSMGGLVIREFLNDVSKADKVTRVLTAGTPYWGAPKAHFSLLGGYTDTPVGSSLDHITWANELQHLSRNLQGAFFLYPSSKLGSWLAVAKGISTPFYPQNINGENNWVKSLGANPALLKAARSWHARNDGFPKTEIDYRAVVGSGSATVHKLDILALSQQKWAGNMLFGDGDGTVPIRSATQGASEGAILGKAVPIHYACGVDHVSLPGHGKVLPNVWSFLSSGEDITGLDDKCPYAGSVLYLSELNVAGGDTDISSGNSDITVSVPVETPLINSLSASAQPEPIEATSMTLDEAADLGLLQYFRAGSTSVIVTDDAHPVTITVAGKENALQMQKISSAKTGPLESYRSIDDSIIFNPIDQAITSNGAPLEKIKLSKKPPKTTAKLVKQGTTWTVTLNATSPNGVFATYYRLGKKGVIMPYSSPLILNRSALKTLSFYSVDPFGKSEIWRLARK